MAVITATSFDPLKARCNVRLQQGVPIVDADWNEFDDIRKFEMRAYLKWFVGDGIPDGSNAFHIDAIAGPAVADDFIIRAGAAAPPAGTANYDQALRFAGRAIVDGLDVIIKADSNYKAQPLFTAAAFGVPQIAPMPNAAGPMAVYLDIWERLVTSQEDPSLVLPGIGTESCARMKREWVVRTRTGSVVPQPVDADFIAGHSYYLLGIITRSAPGATVAPGDVQDSRHLRLSLTSLESRVANMEKLLLTPSFLPSPFQFDKTFGLPGANVTLFGNNFNIPPVSVKLGATTAVLFSPATTSQITITVPAMGPGQQHITVQTGGGSAVSVDSFQVLAPAPAFVAPGGQFNPTLGPAGTSVNLFGTNLNVAPVSVKFGVTVAVVGAITATQVTVTVPAMAVGATNITIQTGGGSITSVDKFNVT